MVPAAGLPAEGCTKVDISKGRLATPLETTAKAGRTL